MVADHQDLDSEGSGGIVHHLDQPWHEFRAEPAILFIEHEESAMAGGVKSGQRELPEAYAEDVGNGTSLAAEDVFLFLFVPVTQHGELHGRHAALEIRNGAECDRLLKNLLQRD